MGSKSPLRKLARNVGLLNLIRSKRERAWRPSPAELQKGFRGWHQRGYLPHFDAPGVTQFVTFQLYDSFPVRRNPEFESILNENDLSIKRRKLEAWLDRGNGECWLRQAPIAEIIEAILLQRHAKEYQLDGWTIMPNHVHVVVEVWDLPLTKLINRWKEDPRVKRTECSVDAVSSGLKTTLTRSSATRHICGRPFVIPSRMR